jgi:Ca2+-dependent lipid-binding protein
MDKVAALKVIKAIETYVINHFYGDWYWNSAIMIGTCFFAWLAARLGGGILSFVFILLFTNSVYRLEYRRFNRDIRDDLTRIHASNRLENELESMEWLNSFMDKFWVIYMPALSEQVLFIASEVLKDQAPGFGIDKLSLDEFTLGSKAPRVDSIKSYTKKGHDHIEMDWDFSFAPNDTDDMTKKEIQKKINPKVALGVTVGKAFISKSLPILVEDMSFTGRMNIKLKLTENFPHVKMVSIQFLEAPTIDYALKPIGGDTLGLDIMSFIPGLSSFVNGLIHSNLRPILYAPNSLDIDVEEIMAQQSNDSIGVVAVTITKCTKLKTGNPTKPNSINPYVQLKTSGNADIDERTSVKDSINDPVFLETKYILVNTLEGNHLNLNVFHLLKDKADDQLIGTTEFSLAELLQEQHHTGVVKSITEGGKTVGKIEFDITYFPQLEPFVLEDGTKEPVTDCEVGIMKLNLHAAKDLDISDSIIGLLNPYAEIYVNDELVKTCRKLRQNNNPSWEQAFESLITQQSKTRIQVLVKDTVEDNIVAKLDANLQDLIFETSRGNLWISCPPIKPDGNPCKIKISAGWKALAMDDDTVIQSYYNAPIGGVRIHLRSATGLKNLETVGKVDPYARILLNGKVRARTNTIANTLDPNFNNVYILPVANEHQHFLIDIVDEEAEQKDRSLGSGAINVEDFLKKNDAGYYLAYDGSNEIIEQPILLHGQPSGTLSYSVSFIPTIPVYTISQIHHKDEYLEDMKNKKIEEAKQREKDEKLFKEHPNEYEWVEINEDNIPEPKNLVMPLEQAIKYRAGTIAAHVLSGRFEKSDVYVHTLFDDYAYPSGVSPRTDGNFLHTTSIGEGFIRDLPNSMVIFRVASKVDVNTEKHIVAEKTFSTLDILKRSYSKPLMLKIDDKNTIKVQLEFIPTAVKLAPFDTILDVGKVKLEILSAENLPSVDSNGKSDPLVVIKLDGVEIFKTDKKRRTLDPIWNEAAEFPMLSRSRSILMLEVYDWDLTHDDELLGRASLDLSSAEPFNSTQFQVKLDTQGVLNLRATFKPEYIRPKLHSSNGLGIDLGMIAGAPMKVVGGVTGVASNVVGGGVGAAADGVTKGTSFFKHLGKTKRKPVKGDKGSDENNELSDVNESFDGADTSSTANDTSSTVNDESSDDDTSDAGSRASQDGSKKNGTVTNYLADLQSLRSGQPPSVKAVPNIQNEHLPPPQRPMTGGNAFGHARSASGATDVSSFVGSIHGPDAIPGRITIISADGISGGALEVKVTLKTSTKEKELYKTRSNKIDKETNLYKWNESVPFKAASSGELRFDIKERHVFGKSVPIASAVLHLSEALNKSENIILDVGEGHLTLNIRYVPTH